jgi:hypothetical protein
MYGYCVQKLGWLGFCQAAFPAELTELIVVDYLGYTWKVLMDFCHDEGVSCIFSGQWQALASAHRLSKGQIIRLGVTDESNNRVKYLCAPPMLVLRTTILPSAETVQGGASYRVLEYFWRN